MKGLGHELLLLMLNLSRMKDRGHILRLFVEALSAAVPGVTIRNLVPPETSTGEIVEIATPDAHFGTVAIEDAANALSDEARAALRNCVRMLAVVLENLSRAERLATENARLDAAVAARTAELTEALAESQDLYQHAPCGYLSLDSGGLCVRANDTGLRWLGYYRGDIEGRVAFLDLVAPTSRETLKAHLDGLERRDTNEDVEIELSRRDGTLVPVLLRATLVIDSSGQRVMTRATIHDISERKRAARALRETEERYRRAQKLEAIGRLAGGVAHDFNNLLVGVFAGCSELADGLPPGDGLREAVALIQESAERAAALTRQLLAVGREQVASPVSVDLGQVMDQMEKILRRLVGAGVDLSIRREGPLWRVRVDPTQVEQVLLNLVVNARDAMPNGGLLEIEMRNLQTTAPDGACSVRHVSVVVRDNGAGMSPDTLARLFEPFFTTKERGTGLGLATVYGIVVRAGGTISVDSTPGSGTRFEILFPAEREDSTLPPGGAELRAPDPESHAESLR